MVKKLVFIVAFAVMAVANERPALVSVETLGKEVVSSVETFTGSVAFAKNSKLSIEGSGKVQAIYFQEGDHLKKGDLMLALDTQTLQSRIDSAKAMTKAANTEYEQAKTDYERFQKLIQSQSIAQKTFDDSRFRVEAALAKLDQAKASLNELNILAAKAKVYAPFDGVVANKNSEVGEWVGSGSVIATLVDSKNIELIFNLPAHYASVLEVGQSYEVQLAQTNYLATLEAKLPMGDHITRTFAVKLGLESNDFFFEGMEAVAKFPSQAQIESFVVSRDAVVNRFGGTVIIVVDEGKAQVVPVSISGYGTDYIAIEAQNLQEGMQVITKGNERVFPDQTLQIINR